MKSVTQKKMRNLFLQLAFKPYFVELIFAIDSSKLFSGSNVYDLEPKSQK